ncbi:hypothetical protein I4U23_023871 [Adineta vaga]|nr:hypothetical protein I4U23_023871 [Adineta vaga]
MTIIIGHNCKSPEDIPLFNNDYCVSSSVYTTLFLTTIILAGITFLLFISLVILIYARGSTSSNSSYPNDDEPNLADFDDDDDDTRSLLYPTRKNKKISNVLKTALDDISSRDTNQTYDNHNFFIPTTYAPVSTSSRDLRPIPSLPDGRQTEKSSNSYKAPTNRSSTTRKAEQSSRL